MIAFLLLCCITIPALAVEIAAYEGFYDNLADWPEVRIYADNLSFTDKQTAQYIAGGTLEEEILKNVRSVAVFRDDGFAYEKGFLMIDASAVKSETRQEGYEVLLYLTVDTSQNYIVITVFVTGSAVYGASTQPEQTGQEPLDGAADTVTDAGDAPGKCTMPTESGEYTPPIDTEHAAPIDTPQSETTELPATETQQEKQALNIGQNETVNALLRCTLGLEILAGLAAVAVSLPKIWVGFHVLAWYHRKKKEVAERSRAHAA